MKKIILFIQSTAITRAIPLVLAINRVVNEDQIEVLTTLNTLKSRLSGFFGSRENEIYILFADSKQCLDDLTTFVHIMEDRKLIIVLPDESISSLSKASKLFPRFSTPVNDSYTDLCSVLGKMIHHKIHDCRTGEEDRD